VIARKLDKQGVSSGRLNSTIATPRSSQRGSERAGWRLATDGRTGVEPMSAAQHRASMTATPQQPVPRIPSRAWFACCPTRPASGRALPANPTRHTAGESFAGRRESQTLWLASHADEARNVPRNRETRGRAKALGLSECRWAESRSTGTLTASESEMSRLPVAEKASNSIASNGSSPLIFFILVFSFCRSFLFIGALTSREVLPGLPMSSFMWVCPAIAAAILAYREKKSPA
jgi:hypothetical protein